MAMRQVEIDHKVSELQKAANKLQVPPPREIVDIGSEFGALLTEAIAGQAHRVFEDLSPRQFEEFIAEIWSRFGFSVELTKSTRDGGYDVVAVSDAPARLKFLIECKRWKKESKVSVSIVRGLYGVKLRTGSSKAIIATTSSFTKPASLFLESHPYELEGRDYDDLIEWCRAAQQPTGNSQCDIWTPRWD